LDEGVDHGDARVFAGRQPGAYILRRVAPSEYLTEKIESQRGRRADGINRRNAGAVVLSSRVPIDFKPLLTGCIGTGQQSPAELRLSLHVPQWSVSRRDPAEQWVTHLDIRPITHLCTFGSAVIKREIAHARAYKPGELAKDRLADGIDIDNPDSTRGYGQRFTKPRQHGIHSAFAKGIVNPKDCPHRIVGLGGIAYSDLDRRSATAEKASVSLGNARKFFANLNADAFPQAHPSKDTENSPHAATNVEQDIVRSDAQWFHVSAQQLVIYHLIFERITVTRREPDA
jgi:hypothetical protein